MRLLSLSSWQVFVGTPVSKDLRLLGTPTQLNYASTLALV